MSESQSKPPAKKPRRLWVVFLAIVYVLLPFDLVPEALLPFLGWLDDAGVLAAALTWFLSRSRAQRREQEEEAPGERPVGG